MAKYSAINIDLNNSSDKEVKYQMRVTTDAPLTFLEIKSDSETEKLDINKLLEYNITIAAYKTTKIAFINTDAIANVKLELNPFPDAPTINYKYTQDQLCNMEHEEEIIWQEITLTHEKGYDIYYTTSAPCDNYETCTVPIPTKESTLYDGSTIILNPEHAKVLAIAISPEDVQSDIVASHDFYYGGLMCSF